MERVAFYAFLGTGLGYLVWNLVYTSNSPDSFVFLHYVLVDRAIEGWFYSLISNELLFYLLKIVFVWANFNTALYVFITTVVLLSITFIFKYRYIYGHGKLAGVLLVFFASFYAMDINRLRENLALLLLFIALEVRWGKCLYLALSGFSHFIPLSIFAVAKNRVMLLFAPVVVALLLPEESRLWGYLQRGQMHFYMSNLLLFPSVYVIWGRLSGDSPYKVISWMVALSIAAGIAAFPFSAMISSRMIELGFVISAMLCAVGPRTKREMFVMYAFAIAMFVSRTMHGIGGAGEDETDYVEMYRLTLF